MMEERNSRGAGRKSIGNYSFYAKFDDETGEKMDALALSLGARDGRVVKRPEVNRYIVDQFFSGNTAGDNVLVAEVLSDIKQVVDKLSHLVK